MSSLIGQAIPPLILFQKTGTRREIKKQADPMAFPKNSGR
jgi:hypothetical protein